MGFDIMFPRIKIIVLIVDSTGVRLELAGEVKSWAIKIRAFSDPSTESDVREATIICYNSCGEEL